MKLIECVPNFSEGRRPEVVGAIRDAIAAVEGVTILDVFSPPRPAYKTAGEGFGD